MPEARTTLNHELCLALTNNDYETAKAQFTRVREHLAIAITYWRDPQNDDAIKRFQR